MSKYICVSPNVNDNLDDFDEKTFEVKQTNNHPLPAWAKDNQQMGSTKWETDKATPVMRSLKHGQMHAS